MPALRDVIVHRLQGDRVRALFGVPGGGGNLDLIDAAGRARLPFVLTATETGGALAALAQAEVTGRPGRLPDDARARARRRSSTASRARSSTARPLLVFTDSHARRLQRVRASAVRSSGALQADHEVERAAYARMRTRRRSTRRDRAPCSSSPPGPVHVDCPGGLRVVSAAARARATPTAHGRRTGSAIG